jgi:predicted component of type VI protein secretion system
MKIKFTDLLLSSVLASTSYASSDLKESAGAKVEQSAGKVVRVFPKTIPDTFEGVGDYRACRSDLESLLQSFQGQKLKVFAPEVFAGMIDEGVQIAELGLQIFERLPTIARQVNERLADFESRIKSKNALISWGELADLVQESKEYPQNYWDEFKFDMEVALRSATLQPQVVAAHEYALNQSERWREIEVKLSNLKFANSHEVYLYGHKYWTCVDKVRMLTEHKMLEDSDTLDKANKFFRSQLRSKGVAFSYDLSSYKTAYVDPYRLFIGWLTDQILMRDFNISFNSGSILIHRNFLASYAQNPESLSEWCLLDYGVHSTRIAQDDDVRREDLIALKAGLEHESVKDEVKKNITHKVQAALDETFEWLLTQ